MAQVGEMFLNSGIMQGDKSQRFLFIPAMEFFDLAQTKTAMAIKDYNILVPLFSANGVAGKLIWIRKWYRGHLWISLVDDVT